MKKSKGYVAVPFPGCVIWGEIAQFFLILGFFTCKTGKVKPHRDSARMKVIMRAFCRMKSPVGIGGPKLGRCS